MVFTVVFATIFLVAFAVIAGVVMYLSKTIDHGEARFDSKGKVMNDEPADIGPARPAQRLADPGEAERRDSED
ncbi:hypothetical protein [Erythrobacter sp. MTPC3]|uniref:hypothetical protein n=1 Tax=Erythrobacter sp. MTPC3 TaxID=3056564 RepID=UPI0036F20771